MSVAGVLTATLKINANQAIIVNGDATVTGTVRHFVQLTDFAGNLNNCLIGKTIVFLPSIVMCSS